MAVMAKVVIEEKERLIELEHLAVMMGQRAAAERAIEILDVFENETDSEDKAA